MAPDEQSVDFEADLRFSGGSVSFSLDVENGFAETKGKRLYAEWEIGFNCPAWGGDGLIMNDDCDWTTCDGVRE